LSRSVDRDDEPLYTIGVASRLTRMHPQTLRKYERAGLLKPARPQGNQRLYSDNDVTRLKRIQYLVEQRGVNVAGVELALSMSDRLNDLAPDATRQQMRDAIDEAVDMSHDPAR
jgi:MerR family transcriptional regulator, heat shock protein HspR